MVTEPFGLSVKGKYKRDFEVSFQTGLCIESEEKVIT
jgi:hypothetical protein